MKVRNHGVDLFELGTSVKCCSLRQQLAKVFSTIS